VFFRLLKARSFTIVVFTASANCPTCGLKLEKRGQGIKEHVLNGKFIHASDLKIVKTCPFQCSPKMLGNLQVNDSNILVL
jgi:hypothetical protein